MKNTLILLCLCVFTNNCLADIEPETILQKMINKYASLKKYQDTGEALVYFNRPEGKSLVKEITFKTIFVKNSKLYFEWIELPSELDKKIAVFSGDNKYSKPRLNYIKKNKDGVNVNYAIEDRVIKTDISSALSAATGISSGLTWMIPRFLSPEIPCPVKLGTEKTRLLTVDEGVASIELKYNSGTVEILHIDMNTLLLKSYETKRDLQQGTKSHTLVTYNAMNYD